MSGQYKIIVPKAGITGASGDVKTYLLDEIVDVADDDQSAEMDRFVAAGWAIETKVKPAKKTRARNSDGSFIGDDPSTPDVNEAYTDKPKKKKATAKKKTSEK